MTQLATTFATCLGGWLVEQADWEVAEEMVAVVELGGGLFRLVCLLSLIGMAVIFFAGIQPPNDWALQITVGFLVLALLIWLLVENRRFKGPPIGAEIAKRQAEIKAAEAAVGGGAV